MKKKDTQEFLYNPNNPKKSFDVYINKNPSDTIPVKYSTVQQLKETITKLEYLYKANKYPHKRIWQVGMIMKVRLEAMKKHKKDKFPNGVLFKKQTSSNLIDTISWFEENKIWKKFNPEDLNNYSQRFNSNNFITKIDSYLNEAWESFQKNL